MFYFWDTIFFLYQSLLFCFHCSGSVESTSVDEGGSQEAAKSPTRESPGSVTDSSNAPIDPFPKKLRDTVHARLKSDAIMGVVIAVATTLLHWSGFFAKLQVL